ncbi:MAG: hypothetical protein ACHQHN_07960, partial [Sphingobacteriales bacterium]
MKKIYLSFIAIVSAVNFSQAQWTTSGSNIYNSNTGNVGVGTTNPVFKLDVVGNFRATSGGHINFLTTGAGSGDGIVEMNNASDVEVVQIYTNGVSFFNGGNIGIGTTTPNHAGFGANARVVTIETGSSANESG